MFLNASSGTDLKNVQIIVIVINRAVDMELKLFLLETHRENVAQVLGVPIRCLLERTTGEIQEKVWLMP